MPPGRPNGTWMGIFPRPKLFSHFPTLIESSHSRPSFDIICVIFCSSPVCWVQSQIPKLARVLITNCATVTDAGKDPPFANSCCRSTWLCKLKSWWSQEHLPCCSGVGVDRARRAEDGHRFQEVWGFHRGASQILGLQGTGGWQNEKICQHGFGFRTLLYLPASSKGYIVPFNFRLTLQVLSGFCRGVWVPLFKRPRVGRLRKSQGQAFAGSKEASFLVWKCLEC